MTDSRTLESRSHQFAEVVNTGLVQADRLAIDDLRNVRLTVTADLGEASMLVREVLELKVGSVIALNKVAGDLSDIYVNGIPIGKAEVIVIGDSLHVRIAGIIGTVEPEKGITGSEA